MEFGYLCAAAAYKGFIPPRANIQNAAPKEFHFEAQHFKTKFWQHEKSYQMHKNEILFSQTLK